MFICKNTSKWMENFFCYAKKNEKKVSNLKQLNVLLNYKLKKRLTLQCFFISLSYTYNSFSIWIRVYALTNVNVNKLDCFLVHFVKRQKR